MNIGSNRLYFVYMSTFFVCFIATSGFVINKRNILLDEEMPGILERAAPKSNEYVQELCHISVPCAWEVYRPFKRTFEYLIKNTCECPNGYSCVKSGEDLSISAYIYKCQLIETNLSSTDDHGDHDHHHNQVSPAAKST